MSKIEIIFDNTQSFQVWIPGTNPPYLRLLNQDCGGTYHEPYHVSRLGYHFERRAPVVALYRLRQITASSPMGLGNGEATNYAGSFEKSSPEGTCNAVRYHAAKAVCRAVR